MKKVSVIFTLVIVAGCTNYVYHRKIQAPDSNDVDHEVVIYWSKTDPLIGG
jgi:hypothetical protein